MLIFSVVIFVFQC